MLPYSKEMRRDVLSACDAGGGTRAVALRFDVSESWVRRVKQERRELGKTGPLDHAQTNAPMGRLPTGHRATDCRATGHDVARTQRRIGYGTFATDAVHGSQETEADVKKKC